MRYYFRKLSRVSCFQRHASEIPLMAQATSATFRELLIIFMITLPYAIHGNFPHQIKGTFILGKSENESFRRPNINEP